MARYDIDIDHRIVSVVQMGDDEVRTVESTDHSSGDTGTEPDGIVEDTTEPVTRPAIAAIMVRSGHGETQASVTLTIGDQVFDGTSTGPAGLSHRARLVAVATLEAVSELLGQPCEVESSAIVATGTREIALSVLTMVVPRTGEQVLTGAAVVRGDEADAVARSVLAALNRQLAG
jgi:hypothetical protein